MVGRAHGWVTPFVASLLCACGSSRSTASSSGEAGAPTGGTAGTAGTSSGGTSGLGGTAGSAGLGGVAGSGGMGGSGGEMVDPDVSARWTWEECGRIPGDPPGGIRPVAASPATPFAITRADASVLVYPYDLSAPTVLHGPVDDSPTALGFSRDGELLAEVRDNIVIWSVTDGAIVSEIPLETGCGNLKLTFSEQADYVLLYDGGDGCVFSTADGELVGRLPDPASAAFRNDTILATGCSENPAEVCIYDLDGAALRRIMLSAPAPTIVPTVAPFGDAIVGIAAGEAVAWEPDDGSLRWSDTVQAGFAASLFTPSGDRVVLDALREVSDGTIVSEAEHVQSAVTLLASGVFVLTSRPAIFDVVGNSHRVFAANRGPVVSLDISLDGTVLASNAYNENFRWRVADDFSSSTAIWSIQAEGTMNVDVSSDGRWVAMSGDVRGVANASTGRFVWRDDAFPEVGPAPACIGAELRFSPDGRLLAGKRYATTLDVFDASAIRAGPGAPAPTQLLTRFATGGCGQGVAYSADGSELATPEATFSTTNFPPPVDVMTGPSNGMLTFIEAPPNGGPYLLTQCTIGGPCQTTLDGRRLAGLDSPEGGWHPRFSSEGHWIVAAGKLLHLPSETGRTYDENATEAVFAPNGDIIAGEIDGSLVRFCRRDLTL